ncbi:magnesium transporter CorA family protein [Heyndrickxia sporothermodurans]|uniref:magnesium transporter CorA family protein n=1 Tax=Heyndrickxia sporothermodurans TaxID=46224 RepID=UPI002E1AF92F|nr:magnesium transporter CorA family protein [Heyndrickxia sporothermodurans]
MKKIYSTSNWEWYRMESDNMSELKKLVDHPQYCNYWINRINNNESNYLEVSTFNPEYLYLSGSIIYLQNSKVQNENDLFHFFITKEYFITVDLDFSNLPETVVSEMLMEMEYTSTAIEGFFILIGEMIKNYLAKIDDFELRLNQLLWDLKEKNNIEILERIHHARHEILIWKNLMIPIKEIQIGMEEVFGEELTSFTACKRTNKRIERTLHLLKEYQQEIDALVDFEVVVSSHRGNEIMKTLTVLTTLFTPIAAWGALWGMNFKFMPELDLKFGYVYSIIVIAVTTLILYFYLKMKGWTGDILQSSKKHSFFK